MLSVKEKTWDNTSTWNQMLDFATKRDHCLISSLQFLGLYYSAIVNDNKEELINSLFNTIGVYDGFKNWQEFIET